MRWGRVRERGETETSSRDAKEARRKAERSLAYTKATSDLAGAASVKGRRGVTRFASGAAPRSPQHPPPEPRLPFSLCRHIETQKEKRPLGQREGPARAMTETTKTHVILLACGSFNPITKGHIQMFGESSRPPPRQLPPLSFPRHLCFPGRVTVWRVPIRRGVLADPAGERSAPLSWAPGRGCQLLFRGVTRSGQTRLAGGPWGGGWEGLEASVVLGWVGGRGLRAGVRWFVWRLGE